MVWVATTAAALLVLSGCTTPVATANNSPTPAGTTSETSPATGTDGSATPSATATAAPASYAPLQRMDFDCTDVAWDPALGSILAEEVAPAQPAATWLAASASMPDSYAVQSMGGLVCEWSNGQPYASATGSVPDYVGAQVSILPEATEQWATYAELYGFSGDEFSFCSVDDVPSCQVERLINGYWLFVNLSGLTAKGTGTPESALAKVRPFVDSVAALVSSSTAPGGRWVPPAGTLPLPGDPATQCEEFIPHADLQAALGANVDLTVSRPSGGWSQASAAKDELAAFPCLWLLPDSDIMVGELSWLPAGEWAVRDAMNLATLPSVPEATTVAGLQDGESAWIRCTALDRDCYLDVVVGHNWVQVRVLQETSGPAGTIGAGHRAGAVAVAAVIVSRLRAG